MDTEVKPESKIIGFREWISLPGIALPAIKAKIDTGAKTSSLHAYDIYLEKVGKKTYVNFKVHPLQKEFSIIASCRAISAPMPKVGWVNMADVSVA